MGRLLHVEACPVCNYHVEGPLHFGGSTRSRLFIYHRYQVAICQDCENLVSVLVAAPAPDVPYILEQAAADILELEKRTRRGDVFARQLLPLHRHALEDDTDYSGMELGACTVCGSHNLDVLYVLGGDEGEHFDDGTAWAPCPRCEEGRLFLKAIGTWDEIDDAP